MPLERKIQLGPSSVVGIWNCSEEIGDLENQVHLSHNDAIRYNSFGSNARKKHYLATRALLHELTGNQIIEYADSGKPHTINSNEHLSVSHSSDYVALLISSSPFIGLDIQKLDDKIHKIKSRFVNEIEQPQIDFEDTRILTLIWSVKEAVYKIHGDRNVFFKEHIIIRDFSTMNKGYLNVELSHHHYIGKHQIKFEFLDDYVLVYTQLN